MRRAVTLALCCALAAGAVLLWGFSQAGEAVRVQPTPRVLLVVESDTGAFLMQMRKGLQEAVQRRGGTLTSERLAGLDLSAFPPAPGEADAVYLFAPQGGAEAAEALHTQGYPVILLDEELRGQVCVLPDEAAGGRQAGEFILGLASPHPVVIVADPQDPRRAQCLTGVLQGLDSAPHVLLALGDIDTLDAAAAGSVLALEGGILMDLAQRKTDGRLPGDLPLLGFGSGEEGVRLMEAGLLQGLVADDPYALGYLAGTLLDDLAADGLKPALHLAPMRLVTPDTLYNPENVKLMFPLLH